MQMSSPSSSDQTSHKGVEEQPALSHPSNTFSNISAGDDSRQLIVSTNGVVIQAAEITTGQRAIQGMGQMSDRSIAILLGDDVPTTSEEPEGVEGRIS
jgi:hypothetical protein